MAESVDAKEKSDADLAAAKAYEQDQMIDQAITNAFIGISERLTVERINNLKAILSDIIEAQKKEQRLNFQEIAAQLSKEYVIEINAEILQEFLQFREQNDGVEVSNLVAICLDPKCILGINKILEDKKRVQVMYNLRLQDNAVGQDFAVSVRQKLDKTKKIVVNKYATSGAVLLGGSCLGTGINMIITAGGLVAAGAFPIGLAVVGGVIIIGAGLYYAKKKHDRIAEFLPALYGKAKNARQMRIEKLDGQERHKRLESLAKKRDRKNEKNRKLAQKEIDNYIKRHDPGYSDHIKKLQEELDAIDTIPFTEKLQKRRQEIIFGKGGEEVEQELAKLKRILTNDTITDSRSEFRTKHGTTFKDDKSFKQYLIERVKDLENKRAGSLRQLEELQKNYNDALIKKTAEINGNLEKKEKSNAETYAENASLVENKSIKLRWYKKIVPYFAYWGTCIAINVRSLTVSADELLKVAKAGVAQAKKVQEAEGGDRSSIPELKKVEDIAKSIENAREQFEERVLKVIDDLELPGQENNFRDYLTIEECCPTDEEFQEKIARLVSGDKIKNIMLRIFYTHPSTVFSVLDKDPENIIKNIEEALKQTGQHLLAFPNELACLDSLQIYFPPDENNTYDYDKFMLVSSKGLSEQKRQEDFFEHILEIKKSIMEVNKTLHAVSPKMLQQVKEGIKEKINVLIRDAVDAAAAIEKQLETLDVAEESNRYRAVYLNIFSGFLGADLDSRIKKADFSDVILVLDDAKMKEFAAVFNNVSEKKGILKEFFEIFSKDSISQEERFKFFQKIKIIEMKTQEASKAGKVISEEGEQLAALQKGYKRFVEGKLFAMTNLQTLEGNPLDEEYIKNNEHLYHSQRVLIDQKRGVLEEVQKSLVLSIPEIEDTLAIAPRRELRRIAKKRRINYGIPYNPSMSLSMDYISDLFKSTRLAFGKMKEMLFDLKFPNMTINSINMNLGKILEVVSDENIPMSFENAIKFLSKIRGIKFPGFDFELMFGSLFDTMQTEGGVLNRENQKKVVNAIKGLQGFLAKIPLPFSDLTFTEFMIRIHDMSFEIGTLSFRLTQLNPLDVNDALEIKSIVLRLQALKKDFNHFNISIGDIDLKSLVRELPEGFPFKNELNAFAMDFDPFLRDFKNMTANFGKLDLGDFPLDDFLYICNCAIGFGGFGDLMPNFLKWLKEYAELDRKIKDMEKNRKKGDTHKYNKLKREFDDIRIKLEKFGKFKVCLGNVGSFLVNHKQFKLPPFLSGVPGVSLDGLNSLAANLNEYGDFSLDDLSCIVNFLSNFKGIEGITADLSGLQRTIAGLKLRIPSLEKLKTKQGEEELERLKNDLKIAMKQFAMFKDFNVKIGKFYELLEAIPEFSGIDLFEVNFRNIADEFKKFLPDFEATLSGIDLSLALFGRMIDIKNRLSRIKSDFPKLGISEIQLTWDVLWPSFSSSSFGLDFGDLDFNLKAIDLDEIIKKLEALRKLNKDTRESIIQALQDPSTQTAKAAIGFGSQGEEKFVRELKNGSLEVEKDLDITLFSLYTIKATIAIINAIKRSGEKNEDFIATELLDLAKKAPILQQEIHVIVDNLTLLKEISLKTEQDLDKIKSLERDLVLKGQALKSIKSDLFELQRLREAFSKSDKITIDTVKYDEPPISNMLAAMGVSTEDAKKIASRMIEQAKAVSEAGINSAIKTVELAEITVKLSPLVDTIRKIDRKDFTSELKSLVEEARELETEVSKAENKGLKKFRKRLSRLRRINTRLLELKNLANIASEIPSVDFTKDPYLAALKPLGLSGTMVTSFVENAKEISSKEIDAALRQLKLAEIPLKVAALNKNIKALSQENIKPLLELLKYDTKMTSLDLGKIVAKWRAEVRDPVDFFKLINAAKEAESLFNELGQMHLADIEHKKVKEVLSKYQGLLNRLAGQAAEQDTSILFSNIYDFCNTIIIDQAQAEMLALKSMLGADVAQDQDALLSMDADAFMKKYSTDVDRFLKFHEDLMKKFHEYHILMRFSKKLSSTENRETTDIEDFKKHYQNIIGLENKMNNFLEQKARVSALLAKVSVPAGEESTGVKNFKRLKEFVAGLEMFYDLHNPQVVYQQLESAKKLYQELQTHHVNQDIQHDKSMVFSGAGAPSVQRQAAASAAVSQKKTTKRARKQDM